MSLYPHPRFQSLKSLEIDQADQKKLAEFLYKPDQSHTTIALSNSIITEILRADSQKNKMIKAAIECYFAALRACNNIEKFLSETATIEKIKEEKMILENGDRLSAFELQFKELYEEVKHYKTFPIHEGNFLFLLKQCKC